MTIELISPENVPPEHFGTLVRLADGRTQVRFERHFKHPIERVWAAITVAEQRDQWFPNFRLEPKLHGSFEIWFSEECDGPAHVQGSVIEFEPGRILHCGSMRYELSPTDDGCQLVFTDVLHFAEPRSDEEITNAVLGGWHRHTDNLEEFLDGVLAGPYGPEFDYRKVDVAGRD